MTENAPALRSLVSKPGSSGAAVTGSSGVTTTLRMSMRRSSVAVGSQATTSPRLTMAIWSHSSWASSR